jgi:hypothetical protein
MFFDSEIILLYLQLMTSNGTARGVMFVVAERRDALSW